MNKLQILSKGCPKCRKLAEAVRVALAQLKLAIGEHETHVH